MWSKWGKAMATHLQKLCAFVVFDRPPLLFSYKSNESLSESLGGVGAFVIDRFVSERLRSCPCCWLDCCCCWRCIKLLFVKLVRDAAEIIDAFGSGGGGGASESLSESGA
eukprot:TRINITY_DN23073_c0_g1_i1.p1 TRINITY_DN23073_c0_g1~~TRINITY_DN23073_c0_g1_i1.p1  ORF type:complete len:110 (+),score=0.72 TRINITY_DN23073_c0_g1_i1:653-982(+)